MKYRKRQRTSQAPSVSGTFAIGRDTGTLFYIPIGGAFFIVVGRGLFEGREGEALTKAQVSRGRGFEYCFPGDVIEIEV